MWGQKHGVCSNVTERNTKLAADKRNEIDWPKLVLVWKQQQQDSLFCSPTENLSKQDTTNLMNQPFAHNISNALSSTCHAKENKTKGNHFTLRQLCRRWCWNVGNLSYSIRVRRRPTGPEKVNVWFRHLSSKKKADNRIVSYHNKYNFTIGKTQIYS